MISVTVGKNAFIAAGSTITDEVHEDAFAIARSRQVNKEGYSKVLEEKRNKIGKIGGKRKMKNKITVFALSSSVELAQDICDNLGCEMGKSKVHHFADGEILVEIDESVRGKDVFIGPINI